jgi:hypothetical protein
VVTIRAQIHPSECLGAPILDSGRCSACGLLVDSRAARLPTMFTGRFLDGMLTWLYPAGTPGPGYAVGHDGRLWCSAAGRVDFMRRERWRGRERRKERRPNDG